MAETRVIYDGNRLIPAPLVSINKSYDAVDTGQKLGTTFNLIITGTLVAYKGSPNSSGTFHAAGGYPADEDIDADARLAAIERKIDAIRKLFATDGLQLEFQSGNGGPAIKCNPIVESIVFDEDIWYDTARYTINLRTDRLYGDTTVGENEDIFELSDGNRYYISSANENWSLQSNERPQGVSLSLGEGQAPPSNNDSRTYTLTHTINATGKVSYKENGDIRAKAWENAARFVEDRAGYDGDAITQTLIPVGDEGGSAYNHIRSLNYDELAGTYNLTETWTIANQNYLEDYTVTTNTASDTGLSTVSISGSVTGLYLRSSNSVLDTTTGYENADAAWNVIEALLITRAQNYSGLSYLNIVPVNTSVGRNPAAGVITYTYQYDTKPVNAITGTRSEVINVSDNWGINVFAEQTIIGRSLGPLLQDIGTFQSLKRNLNIEAVFVPESGVTQNLSTMFDGPPTSAKADIQNIVDAANPATHVAIAFVSNQNQNWNPLTGRLTYAVEWTYENRVLTTNAGLKIQGSGI